MKNKKLEMKVGDEIILRAEKLQNITVKLDEKYYSKGLKSEIGSFKSKGIIYLIPLNDLTRIEGGKYLWKSKQ